MRSVNYYPHHIGDYSKDTAHLTLLQHGAYRLLLDHCYATEKPLPSEKPQLYVICRAMTKLERAAVDFVVTSFFRNGLNKRVSEEIAKAQEKSAKARQSAQVSVQRRLSERSTNAGANAHADAQLSNNQEPRTNTKSQEQVIGAPEDLSKKPLEISGREKAAAQNPAWLFNFGHAQLYARQLGIHVAGKTHQELKDAINAKIRPASAEQRTPKFA